MCLQGLLKDVILLAGADLSSYVCPSRRPSLPDVTFARTFRYVQFHYFGLSRVKHFFDNHFLISYSDSTIRLCGLRNSSAILATLKNFD